MGNAGICLWLTLTWNAQHCDMSFTLLWELEESIFHAFELEHRQKQSHSY
jgi:hypothetical protein